MSKETLRLLAALAAMVLIVPAAILDAWVYRALWWWFVVPFGVKPIGMAWAYGLSVLVGALRFRAPKNGDEEYPLRDVLVRAVAMMIALCAGWIAHSFM